MSNIEPSAIIATGGKQYRVKVGQTLQVEKLEGEPGTAIVFGKDAVLLVSEGDKAHIGAPYLDNAQVEAEIVEQGRGDKVTIIKMRRRKTYRRKQGHRQYLTSIKIKKIQAA